MARYGGGGGGGGRWGGGRGRGRGGGGSRATRYVNGNESLTRYRRLDWR